MKNINDLLTLNMYRFTISIILIYLLSSFLFPDPYKQLDILDNFKQIKVCTHYEYNDKKINEMSNVLNNLDKVKPIFKHFKGWECSLENISNFNDLPEQAKEYINYLSNELGVPINIISIGPKRNQILYMQKL